MNWSCVEIVVIKKSDFFEVWIPVYVEIFIDSKYKTKNKKLYEDVCFLDCLYDYKVRWLHERNSMVLEIWGVDEHQIKLTEYVVFLLL